MRKAAAAMGVDLTDRPCIGVPAESAVRAGKLRREHHRLALWFSLIMFIFGANLPGQAQRAAEYQVKAAFLYNFGKYVRWPAQSFDAPGFEICVLGSDPFGGTLDNLVRGEKMEGQPLLVRRIRSAADAQGCHIVFLGASESHRVISDLHVLYKYPILTVSDIQDFADDGGMIQFVTEGDRIRFIINLEAGEKCGLGFSSELLKVAKSVQRNGTGVD